MKIFYGFLLLAPLILASATSASSEYDSCETELSSPAPVRFFGDIKTLRAHTEKNPVFVNPGHYEKGRTRFIYNKAAEQITDFMGRLFDDLDPEFKFAIAILLLKSGVMQAQISWQNGDFEMTRLWLNGHPWSIIAADLQSLGARSGGRAVIERLSVLMADNSRVPKPQVTRFQFDDTWIDLFLSTDRYHRPLAEKLRSRLMDDFQVIMDYRTALGLLNSFIRNKMIYCQLNADPSGKPQIAAIKFKDADGRERSLFELKIELKAWFKETHAARMRQVGQDYGDKSVDHNERLDRLISRIYDRPDLQPMDPTFWTRFSDP